MSTTTVLPTPPPPIPPPPWVSNVQKYSWALALLGLVLPVWLNFFAYPLVLPLLACIAAPIAAIALVGLSRGGFVTVGAKKRLSKGVGCLFFAPMAGLILKVWSDVQYLNTSSSLLPALGGALAGLAVYALWRRGGLGMIIVGAVAAYALYGEADYHLDHGAPQYMRVTVAGKHTTLSRKGVKSYYLDLPPWGPRHDPDSISVLEDQYDATEPGQDVCIILHPGFLRGPWYRMDACPAGAKSTPAPPPS
ncbi:MAG TPA: hypothetical protein VGI95_13965 [Caulobacteraceae bacterium]